jgi:hypothetical protein
MFLSAVRHCPSAKKAPAPAEARAGGRGDCGDHCRTGGGASKTGADLAMGSRLAYAAHPIQTSHTGIEINSLHKVTRQKIVAH